jgi:starvation-inducible DNA-binding protein
MEKLIASLQVVLGNNFLMYFKAHSYHWNVEGIHFSQYHDFFGDLYEDLYGAIDPFSEEIRKLNAYAPVSLMELYNYKTVMEDTTKPNDVSEMLLHLLMANSEVINSLNAAFAEATVQNQQGLANFIAERLSKHKKHEWQLTSSIKKFGD